MYIETERINGFQGARCYKGVLQRMPLVTYLHRHPRTGVYWFRRSVPPDLRAALGRREITESLRTKVPADAKARLPDASARAEAVLEAARVHAAPLTAAPLTSSPVAVREVPFTRADAERIAAAYVTRASERNAREYAEGEPYSIQAAEDRRRYLEAAVGLWRTHLLERRWELVRPTSLQWLANAGVPVPDEVGLAYMADAVLRAYVVLQEQSLVLLLEAWPILARPEVPSLTPRVAVGAQPVASGSEEPEPQPDVTLPRLVELYWAEKDLAGKSADELAAAARRFEEVHGVGRPLRSIGKLAVGRFKAAMLAKPAVLSRAEAALPLPEIVARHADSTGARVSAVTVAKGISLLSAACGWGVHNGYLKENPFSGMQPPRKKAEETPRRDFEAEELRRLFTSPVYTGCRSASRRFDSGDVLIRDALFWLPLLGTYTGCRLEELGQALVADVERHAGVVGINIDNTDELAARAGERQMRKSEGGKSLKTDGSRRWIPLHPVLLAAGAEAYVEELRAKGIERLFPDLEPDRYGTRTAAFSKRFGRLLDSLGLDDRRLVFHSLRHGFKTACRAADLMHDVHDYLTGHVDGTVSRRYGREHAPRLFQAVSKIRFPGIDELFAGPCEHHSGSVDGGSRIDSGARP
jgi:integrase